MLVLVLGLSGGDCFLVSSGALGSIVVEGFFFGDFLCFSRCFSDSDELFSVVDVFSVSDELDVSDPDVDVEELVELFELDSELEATSLRAVDLGGIDDLFAEVPPS